MRAPYLSIALLFFAACGSDASSGGGSGDVFTAKVDGNLWVAEPISIAARAGGGPGAVLLVGTQTVNGVSTSLTITLGNIRGPGTYALGVGSEMIGGTGLVGESHGTGADAESWITENTGVAGTVTVSRLDTRIIGTFAYDAGPGSQNPAARTRVVTEGRFDLPLTGTLPPVAENLGSVFSAKLNGTYYNAWSASAVLTDLTGQSGLQLSTSTRDDAVSISLQGVTGPGTYAVSQVMPVRLLIAGTNGGDADHCCWGVNAPGDTGEVTITVFGPKRVTGTFSGTLQPNPNKPATAPLVITEGTFDVGVR